MCTFSSEALGAILNTTIGISTQALNFKNEKRNNEYRTRVAINNANIAKNEALKQKQLGIDKARLEKISGIQEANKQKAMFASSGLDLNSDTTRFAYDDYLNLSDVSSSAIKNEYNSKLGTM